MTNKKMEEKMNTNKMNDLIADTPQQNVVKIAGIMFLLTLVIPLFNEIVGKALFSNISALLYKLDRAQHSDLG